MTMSDNNIEQDKINKQAEILQSTFEHYYGMARDHYAVTATTSNLLILIVSAILVMVGIDQEICKSPVDLGGAIAIFLIGAFGAIWALKQKERYCYWAFYAHKYSEELEAIMPGRKTRKEYRKEAKKHTKKKFGRFVAECVKDSHLWVYLNLIILLIGSGLFLYAYNKDCSDRTCPPECVKTQEGNNRIISDG